MCFKPFKKHDLLKIHFKGIIFDFWYQMQKCKFKLSYIVLRLKKCYHGLKLFCFALQKIN